MLQTAHPVPAECHRHQAVRHIRLALINLAEDLAEEGHFLRHALVLLAHPTHHVHQVLAAVVSVVQVLLHSSVVQLVPCRVDHVLPIPLARLVLLLSTVQQMYVWVVVVVLHQH